MEHPNPVLISVSAALFPPIKETGRKRFSSFPCRIGEKGKGHAAADCKNTTKATRDSWETRLGKKTIHQNPKKKPKKNKTITTLGNRKPAMSQLKKPKGMLAAHHQISSIYNIYMHVYVYIFPQPPSPHYMEPVPPSRRAVESRLDMMTGKAWLAPREWLAWRWGTQCPTELAPPGWRLWASWETGRGGARLTRTWWLRASLAVAVGLDSMLSWLFVVPSSWLLWTYCAQD